MLGRLARLLALALVIGCASAQAAESPWRALAAGRYDAGALARLKAAGYSISPGQVVWYPAGLTPPPEGIPQPESLYVNNPLTVYGGVRLPVGPDGGGLSDVYTLDGDAAVAFYGLTPPPLTYYSFTMNEFARQNPTTGKSVQTNSSVALSINNANISTGEGHPFGAHFVVIIAAQRAAAQRAGDFFLRQGVPPASINTILFPHRFTKQSASPAPTLNVMNRMTYRTRAEYDAMVAYIEQPTPAMNALHFKGRGTAGDVQDSDLPRWETLLRDDRSELAAEAVAGLNLLATRVQQHYLDLGYQLVEQAAEILHHIDPQTACRDLWTTCNYDAPDALYGRFYCQRGDNPEPQLCTGVMPDDNRRAVIVGLNHHRFGQDNLMTYYSYAVTRLTDLQGIATLSDLQTHGSAASFMGDQPSPDDYFVISLARDCGTEPHCMQIPYDDQPGVPGLTKFGKVEITTRIYLDKFTGTAPNPLNFQSARLFWIRR
jgi:hypothetical protein